GASEPSGPPTDLWVESRGPFTILVRWKAPPKEYWHGKLKGYYVGYKMEGSPQPYSFKTVEAMNVNITHEYLLNSLKKSTKYSIVVKAYNAAGTGPASQELIVKTLDGVLPRPPSVSLLSASDSTISVKWGHTISRDEPVTGYTLHYRKKVGHWLHVPLLASDQTRYTLTGLDSDTTYNVYVTANNRYGRGDPSGILSVRTGD
uniref:Dscam n=1 Tax=Chelicerata TaxID=6843 RepID=UPI0024B877C1|nr:Chain A, Dscam [Chelicerata]7Y6E_B Chain B, Dscam [Chelicerata]7Y6E_C Chain C, Dscam [Chelicerata]7Y6E_D Chain D, Dscam [Chelicerata]7Y6E_E Chain E, Dscam [Chelicerata]7Y6E_F Chain F, Dscam [Chelicerata]7Y6E_G Chain G, Dscam [Chelicerata]